MAKHTNDRLVHHYDTERHQILCGSPAADDHSTKHRRGITCTSCVALLQEQADDRARASDEAPASAGTGG